MSDRIGLFGGSFDPVHCAHVALARSARDHLRLSELRWIPAGSPWQKAQRRMAAPRHRAAMVELAIEGEPAMRIDERELRHDGPSFTIDTVRAVQSEAPLAALFLLLGADQYANLHTWRDWRELLQRTTLAVAARAGRLQPGAAVAAVPHRVEPLPMPEMPVSATAIRARVASGADIAAWVPPAVARYIESNRLYRGADAS